MNTTATSFVGGVYYTQFGEELTLTYTIDGVETLTPAKSDVKVVDGVAKAYVVTATFTFEGVNASELTSSYDSQSLVYTADLLINKASLTLCNPMDCCTAGFPVLHYHPKFAQIHVH